MINDDDHVQSDWKPVAAPLPDGVQPDDLAVPSNLVRPVTAQTKAAVTRINNDMRRHEARMKPTGGRSSISVGHSLNLDDTGKALLKEMEQAKARKTKERLAALKEHGAMKAEAKKVGPKETSTRQRRVDKLQELPRTIAASIEATKIEKRAPRMKESFTPAQKAKLEAARERTEAEAAAATTPVPMEWDGMRPAKDKKAKATKQPKTNGGKGEPRYIKDVVTVKRAAVLVTAVKKASKHITTRDVLIAAGAAAGYKEGTVIATLYDLNYDGWLTKIDKGTYGLGPRLAA